MQKSAIGEHPKGDAMIRRCTDADISSINAIVNEAARAYYNIIPSDCWHEPYMSRRELLAEISAGVSFWGCEDSGSLIGVMGIQKVYDDFDSTRIRAVGSSKSRCWRGVVGSSCQSDERPGISRHVGRRWVGHSLLSATRLPLGVGRRKGPTA